MRTGVWDQHLTLAIRRFSQMIQQGRRHPNYRNLKKVVRGLRRRRNWLMRQGQWPVEKAQPRQKLWNALSDAVEQRPEKQKMVGESFVPKVDYPAQPLLRIKP